MKYLLFFFVFFFSELGQIFTPALLLLLIILLKLRKYSYTIRQFHTQTCFNCYIFSEKIRTRAVTINIVGKPQSLF